MDNSIVKLEYANSKQGGVIWQHPKYHRGDDPMESRTRYKVAKKSGTGKGKGKSSSGLGSML